MSTTHFASHGFGIVHADDDAGGVNVLHHAATAGRDDGAGVHGGHTLDAGAHQRLFGPQHGHGLPRHVGAHQGAVGVVVLQEGDERGAHRHHLARGDVHEVHLRGGHEGRLTAGDAAQDVVLGEVAVLGEGDVGLGDDVAVLVVGRQVVGLIGDPAVDDDAVGGLDEAEGVDAPEGRQRADEADVGALGGTRWGTLRP